MSADGTCVYGYIQASQRSVYRPFFPLLPWCLTFPAMVLNIFCASEVHKLQAKRQILHNMLQLLLLLLLLLPMLHMLL